VPAKVLNSYELLTLRRGLRHSRYVFLSDRLLELGIGYWASGIGFQLYSLAAALNPAQTLSPWKIDFM
jgi:hypothetical protein